MAIIKSGASTDELTIDGTSNAARVTLYDSAGVESVPSVPISIATAPVTVVDNDLIASLDVSVYKFLSLQLTGTWVGTVTFQESNDNGTFTDVVAQNVGTVINPYSTTVTTNVMVKIPVMAKYLRVRVTAFTSGSVDGVCFGYKEVNDTGQISATGEIVVAAGQTIGLAAGVASVGTVGLNAGVASVGTVGLNAGVASVGKVGIDAGVLSVGTMGLDAGSETIGSARMLSPLTGAVVWRKFISGTGTNGTNLTSAATNLMTLHVVSGAATARFFKLYNLATTPVVGTSTPLIVVGMAGPGASNFQIPFFTGIDFSAGLGYSIHLSVDDAGTTPFTVAGEVYGMLGYSLL